MHVMFRFILLLASFSAAALNLVAAPYDYSYGSMAHNDEVSRQKSFDQYISSGAHTSSGSSSFDAKAFADNLRQSLDRSAPPRTQGPSRPPRLGDANWADYWKDYQAPTYHYSAPAVDRRSPQQKQIDNAKAGSTSDMWNIGHDYLAGRNGFARSQESGVFWLQTAFEHGNTPAATELYYYFDPDTHTSAEDAKKDPIQALYWLQKAAKAGDPSAMTILGKLKLQGAGMDVDAVEGLRLLKAALAAGDHGALITLRYAYQYGWGVEKDLNESIKWLRESVRHQMGNDYASGLAELLLVMDDPQTHTNVAEIESLFSSLPNDRKIQLLRAKALDSGALGKPDPAQCVAICREILARNKKREEPGWMNVEPQYLLADHLYEGNGVPRDEIEAFKLYRAACNERSSWLPNKSQVYYASLLGGRLKTTDAEGKTHAIDEPQTALPMLFNALDDEKLPGPIKGKAALLAASAVAAHPELTESAPPELKQSLKFYKVSVLLQRAEWYDPDTRLGIAFGLRLGWFGEVDKEASQAAAERASKAGDFQARFYFAEWDCEDNNGANERWRWNMDSAIDHKVWDAYLWMSDHLVSGQYMAKDLKRAEELLRTAATEGNNRQAQNNLGVMLWRGGFGATNVTEGLGWMDQALKNGLWVAGRNLAKIYHLGLGVEKDETTARAYLEKAGEAGGREAAVVVAEAYEKGDIITADAALSSQWKARANSVPAAPL